MEQQANYIVFQCYGNEGIFCECAYALFSLSRVYGGLGPANTEVWIYTDKPEWFAQFHNPGLKINFRKVDDALLHQWRGAIDFVHRVKIEVLLDFTRSHSGNVLYADTDVVFLKPVEPIFAAARRGELYMHVMEDVVSRRANPILAKLDTYLHDNTPMLVAGKPLWDLAMWNAGVLGFNTLHRMLLEDVLAFTDTEYPKFPKHVVEQFAFSVYFRQAGHIKAAAPAILHYWNLKEVRPLLASFIQQFHTRCWEDIVSYSDMIQMHVLMQEKLNFYSNIDIAGKLLKKHWQPAEYNWNELLTQR